MNIFEYMWGLVFLIAFMDFAANPKKALNDAYCTFLTPGPRITADGKNMYFPKSPCYSEPRNKARSLVHSKVARAHVNKVPYKSQVGTLLTWIKVPSLTHK